MPQEVPIRRSIRRLRWFMAAFEEQVRRVAADTGNTFTIDQTELTGAFVDWLRAFEAQKPTAADDRLPYVGFAAGLMLKALVRRKPLRLTGTAATSGTDLTNPAFFWPEGYVYVAFCLNIRALVLEQEFDERQAVVPALGELRTWWSFKENVEKDPGLAVAFLDLFAGEEPQWTMPDVFAPRRSRAIAARFYREIEGEPPAIR